KEPALPVVWKRWLRTGGELVAWRATQMGADADRHQNLGLDGAVAILRMLGGGVRGANRLWIGPLAFRFFTRGQLIGCATHDPDGLSAPLHHLLLARRNRGHVNFDSRTRCLGALGRLKTAHKRNGDCGCSNATHGAGSDQPGTAAAVDGRSD